MSLKALHYLGQPLHSTTRVGHAGRHEQFSGNIARMARGNVQVCVDAVQSLAVIPLLGRIRGFDLALIQPHVLG